MRGSDLLGKRKAPKNMGQGQIWFSERPRAVWRRPVRTGTTSERSSAESSSPGFLVQLTRLAGQITSKISRHRKGGRLEVWAAALNCLVCYSLGDGQLGYNFLIWPRLSRQNREDETGCNHSHDVSPLLLIGPICSFSKEYEVLRKNDPTALPAGED